jgi:hypothetical protein
MFVTLGQVKFRHWRRHNSAPAQFVTALSQSVAGA